MSQTMVYTFRLFGGNAGKTMKVNGHQFVGGELRIPLGGAVAANFTKVMGYYGAYAKGTVEYEAAVAQEDKSEEKANGASKVREEAKSRSSETDGRGVGSDGSKSADLPTDKRNGAASDSGGGSGSSSSGDGHEDSGVAVFEEPGTWPQSYEPQSVGDDAVKTAVLKLDPSDDDHWVNTGAHKGKPKLAAVEQAFGKAGLTRADIEAVLPNWNRDQAKYMQAHAAEEPVDF